MIDRSCARVAVLAALLACGCKSQERQLEDVAKRWCLTIRASQVLPVYPLSEDIKPGDVFAVSTPLSRQTKLYEQRGFLPLDQLVTRLPSGPTAQNGVEPFDYGKMYRPGFMEPAFGGTPIPRPGWEPDAGDGASAEDAATPPDRGAGSTPAPAPAANAAAAADGAGGAGNAGGGASAGQGAGARAAKKDEAPFVPMPQAAFPTYDFEIDRGAGLKLAVPVSGVPVGLGMMGSKKASGSVAIRDAYTYGVDISSLYVTLHSWYHSDPTIAETFVRVLKQTQTEELYLRVVNRVYLTRGVTVSLLNLDSAAFGLDAGASPEVELLQLSTDDPEQALTAAAAYKNAVNTISKKLNQQSPGGSLRLAQASRSGVTLDEDFVRPLVIGYLGFDVRVFEDGSISAPIPSFSTITGVQGEDDFQLVEEFRDVRAEVRALVPVWQMATYRAAADALGKEFRRAFEDANEKAPSPTGDAAFSAATVVYTRGLAPGSKEYEERTGAVTTALRRALGDSWAAVRSGAPPPSGNGD